MLWINFMHLYQPAHMDGHIIKEAIDLSYWRIVRALEENPKAKFTLNISGCLILRWEELEYFDLIKRIKKLIDRKQIELVGSAAYHPIIPLIPEEEAIQQIKENEKIIKKFFGKNIKLKGFFFPEMAYSAAAAKIVKKLGYEWIILDEISAKGKLDIIKFDRIYLDKNSNLKVIFRSRFFSQGYVPKFIRELKEKKELPELMITATDGELYGLRHLDVSRNFEKILQDKTIKTDLMSNFIAQHKKLEKIKILASNWEATETELKNKNYYSLWQNDKNLIQKELWNLANFAHQTLKRHKKDKNKDWARFHFVRGLSSCTFWWASARDFKLFGAISWSPDEIERGAIELIRSVRALHNDTSKDEKIAAEKIYIKIKKMVWERHWKYYWKK